MSTITKLTLIAQSTVCSAVVSNSNDLIVCTHLGQTFQGKNIYQLLSSQVKLIMFYKGSRENK